MKGVLKPDHIPVNKYQLAVVGLPGLTFTEISGIEEELETTDLPDRTKASGGGTKAGEFDVKIPAHHSAEFAAMEVWFREGQDPITPTYKKPGTLSLKSGTGRISRNFALVGLFISKRGLPDLEMKNEGEMAEVTYTLSYDDIMPTG